jgi:hypothetical protein
VKYVVKSITNKYSISLASAEVINSATTIELVLFTGRDSRARGPRTANR